MSRAEWDGYVRRTTRWMWVTLWCAPMIPVLGGLGLYGMLLTMRGSSQLLFRVPIAWSQFLPMGTEWLWLGAYLAFMAWCIYPAARFAVRTRKALPRVWDCGGCVCPLCMTECATDPSAPPCSHTISRADHAALIPIWEARARNDVATSSRLLDALEGRAQKQTLRKRMQRSFRRNLGAAADHSLPLAQRYRAALVVCLLFDLVMTASGVVSQQGWMSVSVSILAMTLGMPFMLMGSWFGSAVRERCTGCQQQLDSPLPVRCPECGALLASVGAVSSSQARGDPKLMVIGIALALTVVIAPMVFFMAGGLTYLPTRAVMFVGNHSSVHRYQAHMELASRSLAASEAMEVAAQFTEAARASSTQTFVPNNFLLPNVTAGVLPWSTVDDALRATATVECTCVLEASGARSVQAKPVMGGDLFSGSAEVSIVFAGVSFNGRPFVGAATDTLNWFQLDRLNPSPRNARGAAVATSFTIPVPLDATEAVWKGVVLLMPYGAAPAVAIGADGTFAQPPGTLRMVEIGGAVGLEK